MDFITLFPKLSKKCVTLSSLDVSYRLYVSWSEKGIVDYQVSDAHKDKDVTRRRVELNYFEALWLLIVKELRLLGMHLKNIKAVKEHLFAQMDTTYLNDIDNSEIVETMGKVLPNEIIDIYREDGGLNKEDVQDFLKNIPEAYKTYSTKIGGLVQSVLLLGHSPSLIIHKRPLEKDLGFHIFNPVPSEIEAKMNGRDFRDELVTNLIHHTVVNIPIAPMIARFYQDEALFKYTEIFALYSPSELELLEILKQKDFQQIKIYRNGNNKTFELEITNKKDVMDNRAQTIKTLLGLKKYERAEVIFRNNKHIVIKNTIKKQV
jgi:hypothetical protein